MMILYITVPTAVSDRTVKIMTTKYCNSINNEFFRSPTDFYQVSNDTRGDWPDSSHDCERRATGSAAVARAGKTTKHPFPRSGDRSLQIFDPHNKARTHTHTQKRARVNRKTTGRAVKRFNRNTQRTWAAH